MTLQKEGLLGEVGACNFAMRHLKALVDAGIEVVSNQVQYSLLDRRPENGMVQYARKHGIKLAIFGSVGGGWLSDAYLGVVDPGAAAAKTVSMSMYRACLDRWTGAAGWGLFQELLRALRLIADRHGTTIANVAAAWPLYKVGEEKGGWVIMGVRDDRHLEEHVALLEGKVRLDAEDGDALQRVLDKGTKPKGDIWSHERGG